MKQRTFERYLSILYETMETELGIKRQDVDFSKFSYGYSGLRYYDVYVPRVKGFGKSFIQKINDPSWNKDLRGVNYETK